MSDREAMIRAILNPPNALVLAIGEYQAAVIHDLYLIVADKALSKLKRTRTDEVATETTQKLVSLSMLSRISTACLCGARPWAEFFYGQTAKSIYCFSEKQEAGAWLNSVAQRFIAETFDEKLILSLSNNVDSAMALCCSRVKSQLEILQRELLAQNFTISCDTANLHENALRARLRLAILDEIRKDEMDSFKDSDSTNNQGNLIGQLLSGIAWRCIFGALEYGEDQKAAIQACDSRILETLPNQEAWYQSQTLEIISGEVSESIERLVQQNEAATNLQTLLQSADVEGLQLMIQVESRLKQQGFME